ncbi:hypothetical protein ANN_13133 [Periplaneta americana]|uniref:PiggyBac transposable element-derived protein domain-containing protein n=1 Tax=Periplaneta americana TaxID=6978 RepID=A0ABQ8TKD6_PERAM|nr:hypothetical protein ANN_13133 [Periplaneta americana]
MVLYYGHHSCKMFIKGKPIRFGFKIGTLCSSDEYPYAMKIYQGKEAEVTNSPLRTKVVTTLLNVVTNPLQVDFFFDNFFTSYTLLRKLKMKGFKAIGTVREGRTGRCPLVPAKEMKKKKRGEFDFWCDGDIYMCRWNDNSVVTLASNYQTHLLLGTTKRYSRQSKKRIDVPEPYIVRKYNKGMRGGGCRCVRPTAVLLRDKKWWWNFFSNGLNVAVVAA